MIINMIEWLIDKIFDYDYRGNPKRAILTGGWIILFAFLILLFSHEFLLYAALIGLVGVGFVIAGYFYLKKAKR